MNLNRMIKTKREMELIKKSAEIADSCIPLIEESLKEEKITEKELRKRIGRKIRSQNASLAFQTIVACGKRSAMIHPKPYATDKMISGIGYMDFGACYKGYRSDITVPFVKGKISRKERKIVETTVKAYNLAVSSIKTNEYCWRAFMKIYNFLKKKGFELKHGLGHGIGLSIHQYPFIVIPKKEKLRRKKKRKWEIIRKIKFQDGMVFTIEPGIYIKGLAGCRIENDFLIKSKHLKALTHANLIEV